MRFILIVAFVFALPIAAQAGGKGGGSIGSATSGSGAGKAEYGDTASKGSGTAGKTPTAQTASVRKSGGTSHSAGRSF